MKVRIKCANRRTVLDFTSQEQRNVILADVASAVKEKFGIQTLIQLSLNGKDALDESKALSDLGIVSGDLLQVINYEPQDAPCSPNSSKHTDKQPKSQHTKTMDVKMTGESSNNECSVPKDPDGSVRTSKGTDATQQPHNNEPSTSATTGGACADIEMAEPGQGEVNRYLREPMLCRDATPHGVPHVLELLYTRCKPETPAEALALVLHVLMMESGFQVSSECSRPADAIVASTSAACGTPVSTEGKHSLIPAPPFPRYTGGCLTLTYEASGSTCSVKCVPLASFLMVHAATQHTELTYHVKLKITDYVPHLKSDAVSTFCKLPRLSRMFKDAIVQPVLQDIAPEGSVSGAAGLPGLIEEVQLLILSYLPAASLCHIARTCRHMRSLADKPQLWRTLYIRKYGVKNNMSLEQDWKSMFQETLVLRREMRERARQQSQHFVPGWPPYMGQPHPPLPMAPVYPPGYVGGDYDRDPTFPGVLGPLGGLRQPGVFPRPRFDPIGPLPQQRFPPGRGGGFRDAGGTSRRPNRGGFGPGNFF